MVSSIADEWEFVCPEDASSGAKKLSPTNGQQLHMNLASNTIDPEIKRLKLKIAMLNGI
jgi:hypothetical protein